MFVAGPCHGSLRYLAQVRTGFTDAERRHVAGVLAVARTCSQPVVSCPHRGLWLQPELFCEVNYLDTTRAGRLHGASFNSLLPTPGGVDRP